MAHSFIRTLPRRLVASALALIVVAVFSHDWLASRRWAAYRRRAEDRGVSLDRPETQQAAIPDSENFVAPNGPFAYHDNSQSDLWLADMSGMHFRSPDYGVGERMTTEKAYAKTYLPAPTKGRLRRASNASADPSPVREPRTAEDFLAICEHHFSAQWPAILEAESRRKTQFPIPVSPFVEPHQFSALVARKTAQIHEMRAMAFLDLGRHEDAFQEVQGSFQLVRAIQGGSDPTVVGTMIDMAILSLDLAPVWEGLVDRKWTDEELLALQGELASLHPEAQWAQMVQGERTRDNAIFDALAEAPFWRRSGDLEAFLTDFLGGSKPKTAAEKVLLSLSGCACTQGIVRDSQLAENTIWDDASQQISADGRWHPEGKHALEGLLEKGRLERCRYALALMMAPAIDRAACRLVVVETCVRQASVAVALERYRRKHGDLPEKLDALVPEFISTIPINPLDGQSVRYARESAESFRLISPAGNHPGSCNVSDVWTTNPKESNVVTWYGLAPENSAESKTAAL